MLNPQEPLINQGPCHARLGPQGREQVNAHYPTRVCTRVWACEQSAMALSFCTQNTGRAHVASQRWGGVWPLRHPLGLGLCDRFFGAAL